MNTPMQEPEGKPSAPYEFDSHQNKVIGDLARAMRWVAAPLSILGILYAIAAVISLIQGFRQPASLFGAVYVGVVALLALSLARWTTQAASSFDKVVSTGGQDVFHLMEALNSLCKKYSLLSVFVKIYVAIILIALIGGLIVAISGAFKG